MKCLILAAGLGSRLKQKTESKPLLKLLGLSLIERVILTAYQSGIDDFYVVTGYNSEKVSSFLIDFSKKKKIKITIINNEEWEKSNGISVLKAKDYLKDNFFLVMSDHIFSVDTFKKLSSRPIQAGEVILAVDTKTQANKLVDIDDVTKVVLQKNNIVDIGKEIKEYNAYDTGMFFCTPTIFSAIEKSTAMHDDTSLTGAMKLLAKEGNAKYFDIEGDFWLDVDDEKAFKKANKYLLQELTKKTDGPVSRYLNRPISTRITKYLVKTSITPNQVSIFCFGLAILASIFFFSGSQLNLIIGGILAQASSIIDGCDGEIARLKFIGTQFGGWLDAVLDRYADGFLLMGLTYYLFTSSENHEVVLIAGFLALIGSFLNSYTADKYDGFIQKSLVKTKFSIRIGRDIRTFIIFIGALLNQPFWTLVILATITNLENIRRIILLYKDE